MLLGKVEEYTRGPLKRALMAFTVPLPRAMHVAALLSSVHPHRRTPSRLAVALCLVANRSSDLLKGDLLARIGWPGVCF